MELIQYPQKNNATKIADEIISLENTAWPQDTEDTIFPSAPNTYVTSFVLMEDNMRLGSYARDLFCRRYKRKTISQ